jgi:pentatricopeptide repeat protein
MAVSVAARHLLRRHLSAATSPIPQSTIATVRRLARKGDAAEINSILSPLVHTSPPPSDATLASVVYLYSYSGMLKEAVDAFTSHPFPSTDSLNSLLTPLNRHSHDLSREIPSLFTSLPASKSVSPDKNTYGILINSLCISGGGAEEALPVLKQMEEKNVPVNEVIYTTIIDSFYKENKPERAEDLWKEMCEKGIVPDVTTYNVRAAYKSTHGRPDDVIQLISEIEAANLKPDTITYYNLIKAYCENGKLNEAMDVFKGLEEKDCVPNYATCKYFIIHLCKKGKFDEAQEVFDDGLKRGIVLDLFTVKRLVLGLMKEKKKRAAKRVVTGLRHKFPEGIVGNWKRLEKIVGLTEGVETESV